MNMICKYIKMQIMNSVKFLFVIMTSIFRLIIDAILKYGGITRVYDINSCEFNKAECYEFNKANSREAFYRDITFKYYVYKKILSRFNTIGSHKLVIGLILFTNIIGLNDCYPILGICRYVNGVYSRYIIYDCHLSEIEKNFNLSAKIYQTIKKIEIVSHPDKFRTKNWLDLENLDLDSMETVDSELDQIQKIDITSSIKYFYDVNNFVTPQQDIIRFYLISSGDDSNLKSFDSVITTREIFDEDMRENIVTYEQRRIV